MLEGVSHKLETSTEMPIVQETPEPQKKRLKVLHTPQALEESKKILKKQNKQEILERVLKRLGVQEAPEESKAVVLEDILDARKTSEKVPVVLDTKKMLEATEKLKKAGKDIYQKWVEVKFDINYWFTIDYNIRNGYDQYPLLSLAMDFNLENVVNALKGVKGININAKGPFFQWTSLRWAVENENEQSVSCLVKNGSNVNQLDSSEQTPLYSAAINGNVNIIKTLVQNGADVNKKDITKSNPLYEATKNNHIEATKCLMDSGAKIQASGQRRQTPLHAAVKNQSPEVLNVIIQHIQPLWIEIHRLRESIEC